jgi:protease-4
MSDHQKVEDGVARPASTREWELLEKLLLQAGRERTAARRWGVFFKLLTFVWLFGVFGMMISGGSGPSSSGIDRAKPHVAVIDIKGAIMPDGDLTADDVIPSLKEAFREVNAKAVMLRINSPGGTPVQAATIYREILRLRDKYPEKKVFAVITDVGASGAYYVAAAADEIYADPSSLVGSIGVISDGFGFVEAMQKVGIERRVITAGQNKGFMDPFSPLNPEHKAFMEDVLQNVHEQFVNAVKAGRGDRLKESPAIFSGLVWSGEQALGLGLIDGFGSPGSVAREIIKHPSMVDYSATKDPFAVLVDRLGVSLGRAGVNAVIQSSGPASNLLH